MTRQILAVCQSRNAKRAAAARVLDRYLHRIGSRTWRGYASNECLARISKDLKKVASRNLAVAVSEMRRGHASHYPLFVIGSRTRFSPDGMVPVKVSGGAPVRLVNPSHRAFWSILQLAALFHDLGKTTVLFQDKIRRSLTADHGIADPVRHEVFSAYMLDELLVGCTGPGEVIARLRGVQDVDLDAAAVAAGNRAFDLYERRDNADGPLLSLKSVSGFRAGEEPSIADYVLALILTHHRLPFHTPHTKDWNAFRAGPYLRAVDEPVTRKSFDVATDRTPWSDPKWKKSLSVCLSRLESSLRDASMPELPDLAIVGRTALMMADHVGSSETMPSQDEDMIANLTKNETGVKVLADSVLTHTLRVAARTRGAAATVLTDISRMAGISEAQCPIGLIRPSDTGRFAWQGQAAKVAGDLAATGEGGFFACIMAGTGSGKTRGAPTILAAATFNDANSARRQLRFTLGLGLRTLADQSGKEYTRDIGFDPHKVATIIGETPLGFASIDRSEAIGSEDRLAMLEGAEITSLAESIPLDGEETCDWISNLGHDVREDLPTALGRLIGTGRRSGVKAMTLLQTPVVATTIDHIMPAADARTGGHLPAMFRAMSADLMIDEIDQFSEEDLAAIGRMAFIIGASGRRMLIMSATLPQDIVIEFYEAYRAGWAAYARTTGATDQVHRLVAADCERAIAAGTDIGGSLEGMSTAYATVRDAVVASLAQGTSYRSAMMLGGFASRAELSTSISQGIMALHDRNAVSEKGMRMSAGLIRMTRIQHAQNLARDLPQDERVFRSIICLHAKMPTVQRQRIEHELKKILTRKGDAPNAHLAAFLERRGILEAARQSGCDEVSLVVISSPVIETGNDLDFDWAIVDPSSIRALIQTAGRVNRHRLLPVSEPNIGILPIYSVVKLQDGAKMAYPGVETDRHGDTLLPSYEFEGEKEFLGGCVAATALEKIDATVAIDPAIGAPLRDAEAHLRSQFLRGWPAVDDFAHAPAARLSAEFGKRRRFRRSDRPQTDVLPVLADGCIKGWQFKTHGTPTPAKIRKGEEPLVCHLALPVDLDQELSLFSNGTGPVSAGRISIPRGEENSERVLLDKNLGWRLLD